MRFHVDDLQTIERVPLTPAALRNRLTEMLCNSTVAHVEVQRLDPRTGEYQIVVRGRLEPAESRWDEL